MATSTMSIATSLTRSGVRRARAAGAPTTVAALDGRAGAASGVAALIPSPARQPHGVADPAQGVDQPWLRGVDLLAQVGDVGLDHVRVAAEVVVPDVLEDLHLAQHAAVVLHEIAEQLELGRRQ